MKNFLKIVLMVSCLSPITLLAAEPTALESVTVMALGAVDGRAVVKTSDGRMHALKLGDTIPGTKATVKQILTDKLVVEDTIEKEGQAAVKQTAWLQKPTQSGGKSVVQRLDREGPPKEPLLKPVVIQAK